MLPGVSSKGNEPDPIPDEGKRRWRRCFSALYKAAAGVSLHARNVQERFNPRRANCVRPHRHVKALLKVACAVCRQKQGKDAIARPQLDEDRPCRKRWSAAWAAALRRGLPAKGTTQTPFHITKSAPPMSAGQRANFAPFMETACSTRAGFRYKARRRQPNILEVYPIHGTYCGR